MGTRGKWLALPCGVISPDRPSFNTDGVCSKVTHPHDFEVALTAQTTGSKKWKSAGIRLDVDERGFDSQFASTSIGGSKLHLFHTVEGKEVYADAVVVSRRVAVFGRLHDILFSASQSLVNAIMASISGR